MEMKATELQKLEKEKEQWRENLKIVDSLKFKESDIMDLDIGGTHKITTTRSTLNKVYIYSTSIRTLLCQLYFLAGMKFLNMGTDILLIEMVSHSTI
jgi:hypothetical protein